MPSKVLLCLVGASLLGCDGQPTLGPVAVPDVAGFVTDEVAAQMRDGRFDFGRAQAPSTLRIIDADEAERQARAYLRTYGPIMSEIWERDRGGPIDLADLRLDRIVYAETPYGRLPDAAHPGMRNAFGPYFLATFGNGPEAVLAVAVAAYNTDVRIDRTGQVLFPRLHGGNFWAAGIAIDPMRFHPLSPESAVERVGRATGARTAHVPELVLLSVRHAPVTAAWRLALDRPVELRTSTGRVAKVTHVLVGSEEGNQWLLEAPDQPGEVMESILMLDNPDRLTSVRIPIRPGRAVVLESIPGRGGPR